jgi:hypothetical protein
VGSNKHILDQIDLSKSGLEKLVSTADDDELPDKDFGFEGVNLRSDSVDFEEDEFLEDPGLFPLRPFANPDRF